MPKIHLSFSWLSETLFRVRTSPCLPQFTVHYLTGIEVEFTVCLGARAFLEISSQGSAPSICVLVAATRTADILSLKRP